MGSRMTGFLLLGITLVLGACERQEATPTGPDLGAVAKQGSCDFTALQKKVDAAFPKTGGNPTNSNLSAIVADMKTFYGAGDSSASTLRGFWVLDTIANKGHLTAQGGSGVPALEADLAAGLLGCMTVGNPKPTVTLLELTSALSDTGAFAVRGTSAADTRSVHAHDGTWVLGPPLVLNTSTRYTWSQILAAFTPAPALNAPGPELANRMLVIGRRVTADFPAFSADPQTEAIIFDWKSIPTATFDITKGGVVSGYCNLADDETSQFVQHYSKANTLVEVLGFSAPDCGGRTLRCEARGADNAGRPPVRAVHADLRVRGVARHEHRWRQDRTQSRRHHRPGFGQAQPGQAAREVRQRCRNQ